ncbi:MAG: hypothetical protein K1X27_01790 [Solirubrobacterales bacterium]|nr:hypothetical protein [Solirubrobacterales bacterium]
MPVLVNGLTDAVSISAGDDHTCALRASGQVLCWGADSYGAIGNGPDAGSTTVPTPVVGLNDAVAIAAGDFHTCAVRASGQVVCWGLDMSGQLGDGTGLPNSKPSPSAVQGIGDAVAVTAGEKYSCAARASGTTMCWGNGSGGKLGNYTLGTWDYGYPNSYVPAVARNVGGATAVTAGADQSCAIQNGGQAVCWGSAPLGDGSNNDSSVAVRVQGLADAKSIDSGTYGTCAVRDSGQAVCWGISPLPQLGNGTITPTPAQRIPSPVPGLSDAKSISTSGQNTCAIRDSGQLACWGKGAFGVLGDGTTADRTTPAPVTGIASAERQTLAVVKKGEGTGTISSIPAGINCGSTCSGTFSPGAAVTLTTSAGPGSAFTGWSGACAGSGSTCQVTMNQARVAIATFRKNPVVPTSYKLTVTKAGTGAGTVASNPVGINCGSDCEESYGPGTMVTLIAAAKPGSTFQGWSGPCSGIRACQVTMSESRNVTATFSSVQSEGFRGRIAVTPKYQVIHRGDWEYFRVQIESTNGVPASNVNVCPSSEWAALWFSGCAQLGNVPGGGSKSGLIKVGLYSWASLGYDRAVAFTFSSPTFGSGTKEAIVVAR